MTIAVTIKNAHVNGAGHPAGRSIAAQVYDRVRESSILPAADTVSAPVHIPVGPPTILAPGEECTVYVHSSRGVDITEV